MSLTCLETHSIDCDCLDLTVTQQMDRKQLPVKGLASLPFQLLLHILQFNTARGIADSQIVCKAWKLQINLSERLWKVCYEANWEQETAHDPRIAVRGAETSWVERYKRRSLTEQNWRAGRYTLRQYSLPAGTQEWSLHNNTVAIACKTAVKLYRLDRLQLKRFGVWEPPRQNTVHGIKPALCSTAIVGVFEDSQTSKWCAQLLSQPNLEPLCEFVLREAPDCVITDGRVVIVGYSSRVSCLQIWRVPDDGTAADPHLIEVSGRVGYSTLQADWARDVVYSVSGDLTVVATAISTGAKLRSIHLNLLYYRLALDVCGNRLLVSGKIHGEFYLHAFDANTFEELAQEDGDRCSLSVRRGGVVYWCGKSIDTTTLRPLQGYSELMGDNDQRCGRATPLCVVSTDRGSHGLFGRAPPNSLFVMDFTP